jgi:hypothetical protein
VKNVYNFDPLAAESRERVERADNDYGNGGLKETKKKKRRKENKERPR